jgi:hypothetical protein
MLEEAELFFNVMKTHMPAIIEASRQQAPADVQWHYGEYLDSCEVIS